MVRTAPASVGVCGPGVTSRKKRKGVEINHFLSHNNNSKRLSGSPSGQAWLFVPICPSRFLSFPLAPVCRPLGHLTHGLTAEQPAWPQNCPGRS